MVEDLLQIVSQSGLHWRYELMICVILAANLCGDKVNAKMAKFFADRLTSDVIAIRSVAQVAVMFVLKQAAGKRARKREIRPYEEVDFEANVSGGEYFDKPWE